MVKTLEMALTEVKDMLALTAKRLEVVMAYSETHPDVNKIDLTLEYDAYNLLSTLVGTDLAKFEVTNNSDDLHQSTVATVAFIRKRRAEVPLPAQVVYGGAEILLGEIIVRFRFTSR